MIPFSVGLMLRLVSVLLYVVRMEISNGMTFTGGLYSRYDSPADR